MAHYATRPSTLKAALIGASSGAIYSFSFLVLLPQSLKAVTPDIIGFVLFIPCLPGCPLALLTGQLGPCGGEYATHTIIAGNAIFYGVIGALAIYLIRRRKRKSPADHCKSCGYNLTGNVSGRCPECGKALVHPISKP